MGACCSNRGKAPAAPAAPPRSHATHNTYNTTVDARGLHSHHHHNAHEEYGAAGGEEDTGGSDTAQDEGSWSARQGGGGRQARPVASGAALYAALPPPHPQAYSPQMQGGPSPLQGPAAGPYGPAGYGGVYGQHPAGGAAPYGVNPAAAAAYGPGVVMNGGFSRPPLPRPPSKVVMHDLQAGDAPQQPFERVATLQRRGSFDDADVDYSRSPQQSAYTGPVATAIPKYYQPPAQPELPRSESASYMSHTVSSMNKSKRASVQEAAREKMTMHERQKTLSSRGSRGNLSARSRGSERGVDEWV